MQPADLADPDQSGRVRFFVGAGTIALRGAWCREESGAPEVQLLHLRVRSGIGPIGELVDVRAAHFTDLSASD